LNELTLLLLLSQVQSKWHTSGQRGLFYSPRGWWARRHLFPCLHHRSTSMYAEMIACLQIKDGWVRGCTKMIQAGLFS
jgi:hypothetical protein